MDINTEKQIERKYPTWVVLVRGTTYEAGVAIKHSTRMVKVDMPKSYLFAGKVLKNTREDVMKFINTYVFDENYLTQENIDSRLINVNELPLGVSKHIEYYEKYVLGTFTTLSVDTYTDKRIFGH